MSVSPSRSDDESPFRFSARGRRIARRLRAVPGALAHDPASARYAHEWFASLCFGRNPLDTQLPWLPFKARRWLCEHVDRGTSVFEYGSGGSTLFFAKTAGRIVSVEHDPAWFARVSDALAATSLHNYEHLLREPEPLEAGDARAGSWRSSRVEFAGHSFERYVKSIDDQPDRSLDLAVVDGRARLACLERAVPKLRRGGHLMLDNSERPEYASAFSALARFPRLDLYGLAPHRTDRHHWQTTIWRIADR